MIEFFADYGLFLLKALTVVAAAVIVIAAAAAASRKAAGRQEGLEVENLNGKYRRLGASLRKVILNKPDRKAAARTDKLKAKAEAKGSKSRVFVIDFKGDLKATAVASLREEVSAILQVAEAGDQVVARIENFGGVVHEHGLGASQLARLRDRDIPLTVTVDKVAASGGYLMACVANRIVAAPFAILGSIGVIAQLPNITRLLDSHGIDFEQITAGEYKRTVTMFGKNTDADRRKLKADLDDVHDLFKAVVGRYRTALDLDKVATGEYWYGPRALDLGLADELRTSDELLADLAAEHAVYRISYKIKQPLQKKVLAHVDGLLETVDASGWRRRFETRLPR
jgi:serine protease SohB